MISLKGVAHPLMLLDLAAQKTQSQQGGPSDPSPQNRNTVGHTMVVKNTVAGNTAAGNTAAGNTVVRNDISLGETTRFTVI